MKNANGCLPTEIKTKTCIIQLPYAPNSTKISLWDSSKLSRGRAWFNSVIIGNENIECILIVLNLHELIITTFVPQIGTGNSNEYRI